MEKNLSVTGEGVLKFIEFISELDNVVIKHLNNDFENTKKALEIIKNI